MIELVTFASPVYRDPDIYWMDFKEKNAKFLYSQAPTRREKIETEISSLCSYKIWETLSLVSLAFLMPLLLILIFSSLFSYLLVCVYVTPAIALFLSLRYIARVAYANTSPDRSEDWPSLIMNAENITNPLLMRLENFVWLRFWYSEDVRKQIKEAILLKLPDMTKDREGGWLLSVRFLAKPTSGKLGIGFTW